MLWFSVPNNINDSCVHACETSIGRPRDADHAEMQVRDTLFPDSVSENAAHPALAPASSLT